MHIQYSNFLNLYKRIARFSADMMLAEEALDPLQRTLRLKKKQFISELYEPRDVESVILEFIRESTDLVCFVGPQGAGKTSVAVKVIDDLESSKRHLTFAIYIDLRAELSQKSFDSTTGEQLSLSLRRSIIDQYMDKLFTFSEDSIAKRVELWTFLLRKPSDPENPAPVFHNFRMLREKALRLYLKYKGGHPGREKLEFDVWFKEQALQEPDVRSITEELDTKVDVAHLAYAARFIGGFERQILWVDNIDALQEGLQPEIVHELRKFHHLAAAYLSTVVAVREENVFRFNDPESNAPPYQTRVLLEIPRDGANRPFYPAVDLPVIGFNILRKIVNKRLEFARTYQRFLYEESLARQPAAQNLERHIKESPDTSGQEVLEDFLDEIEDDIASLSPISDHRFSALREISDSLLRTFERENAIFLANNSLRDLLFIHRDCLGFLLKGPGGDPADPPPAVKYPPWYLSTLFLCWIRNTQRNYQVTVYDLIAGVRDWHKTGKTSIGCFFSHLVITCVWNLTLEKRDQATGHCMSPRVKEVIERLLKLGYPVDDIKKEIYNLCRGKTGLLAVRSRVRLASSDELDPMFFVYATYRGKCLIAHTSCSFGYLCECLREENVRSEGGNILDHPDIQSTAKWAAELLPDLCDLADMHIAGLEKICKNRALGKDWLNTYLKWFGVPQIKTYRRSEAIGRSFGGVRRAFQLESVFSSLAAYIRSTAIYPRYELLQKLFFETIHELESKGRIVRSDRKQAFRRRIGLLDALPDVLGDGTSEAKGGG
ncbi:MAG: hypothetical protein HC888_06840 [Candidatus Competibacteraceae bacterium]|nr:hypothetical protein [Candidatus Competibacteraceae bacterium]